MLRSGAADGIDELKRALLARIHGVELAAEEFGLNR